MEWYCFQVVHESSPIISGATMTLRGRRNCEFTEDGGQEGVGEEVSKSVIELFVGVSGEE